MQIYSDHTLGCNGSRIQFIVIALTFLGLIFTGCSKPLAIGKLTEVVVLADRGLLKEIEPALRGALEREILSTRPETTFRVSFAPLDEPGEFRKWSKVIVVGSLDEDESVGGMIPEDVRVEVVETEGLLHTTLDLWARNQVVIFLVTARRADLLSAVRNSGELLFSRINDILREQVRGRMYQSGVNTELESELRDEHGFTLSIPTVYRRDRFTGVPRTVRFFNLNPQRSILVYWEELRRDSLVPGEVLETRMELGERFYPGDRLIDDKLRTERIEFQGLNALRLKGLWENREELEGGTFTTYAFNCPESRRFYLIDTVLFAPNPKQSKYVYTIQLDTIVDSFQCAPLDMGSERP